MKYLLQILFLFLTWFINLANATPVFVKVALPNNELTFSKVENVKQESVALQRSSATVHYMSGYPTYLKINRLENSPTIMRL